MNIFRRHKNNKRKQNNQSGLRLISLGGWGTVTQNLFAYQYNNEILIIDCGVGFPEEETTRGDLLVADVDYLVRNREKIKGIIITHGHEDHYGGLPFILPKLNRKIPIYASRLTTALIKEKLDEYGQSVEINLIDSREKVNLGSFNLDFIYLTHSIPDTFGVAIKTPIGTILHMGDYKFDWTPVMGSISDVGKIATIGNQGVVCLVSDCLRSEKAGFTLSEAMVEDSLEREMRNCRGRVLITTISSNVSRWQQALNVSVKYNRKVILVGRSIEKIFKIASRLGYLNIPKETIVPMKKLNSLPKEKVSLFVAGSQAQTGSALDRITRGEYKGLEIQPDDKVVFSSPDYIPGTQLAINKLVDNLSRQGADVAYSDILDDLHVSGHAAQGDLALMIGLARPYYLVPIGGAFRQMRQYALLAERMGYREEEIILPNRNDTVEMTAKGQVKIGSPLIGKTHLVKSRSNRRKHR
ncbi:MAG TPA: ribonuclease J [Patescibacteria group bacterium]|nr:ribonuclease J [Patescibacteria group bacterium]